MKPSRVPSAPPHGGKAAPGSTARWLLGGPAQLKAGPNAGAVAGIVDSAGQPAYAYPEITGYFLQWLAWRAARGGASAVLADRASAAQRWLAHWLASGVAPATRIHFDAAGPDWRNDALFFFDLAMVLRGLGAAHAQRLIAADPAIVDGVSALLVRLVAPDGLFGACVPHAAGTVLPDRWSTRRGPFLAKAAAGVLTAAETLPDVPPPVRDAAKATFAASLTWAVESPHEQVHPFLYTLEGVLAVPRHPRFASVLPQLSAQFDGLLAATRALGRVPDTLGPLRAKAGTERIDIVAQTLRVGHLLAVHRPAQPPDALGLARVRQILVERIGADGTIPFDAARRPPQANVWAAMFADQALELAHGTEASRAIETGDPLLV